MPVKYHQSINRKNVAETDNTKEARENSDITLLISL